MFIIVNTKNDVIYYIADNCIEVDNNSYLLNNRLRVLVTRDFKMYEFENIPDGVEAEKYCYNETDGFYENINYVEPEEPVTLEQLNGEVEELKATVDYLTMITVLSEDEEGVLDE